ncbi:MAG: nucleotidyltransferase family protein [Roseobacter sp.]
MGWSVMIFAAGFGTRMGQLTRDRPKPMVEVSGRPLIDHALDITETLPASKTVINLHYKGDVLQRHLSGRTLEFSFEDSQILDTGGGLRHALPLLGKSPVLTLNSDAIWGGTNPLAQLCSAWDPGRMDGLLMCVPLDQTVGYEGQGNFVRNANGNIKRGDGMVYSGAQIIKTERLKEIDQEVFSLNLLWDLMIAENRLYAVEYDNNWCDVGHPGGIPLAETMLKNRDV